MEMYHEIIKCGRANDWAGLVFVSTTLFAVCNPGFIDRAIE